MEYYFLGKYNEDEAEKALLANGFIKKDVNLFKYPEYEYVSKNKVFRINIRASHSGKIQIRCPDELKINKEYSKYYTTLEKLVRILKPERLVDGGFIDVFPELLENKAAN